MTKLKANQGKKQFSFEDEKVQKQIENLGLPKTVETAKNAGVVFKSIEEEKADFLNRQAAKFNVKTEDTELENQKRTAYNESLCCLDWESIYERLAFNEEFVLVKLFMKPIQKLGGSLIPDMIKVRSESGQDIRYEINRFPYLACGIVVNSKTNSDLPEAKSMVTLVNDFNPMKNVFFLCKLAPDPNNYQGFALVHKRQIESVISPELIKEFGGYIEAFKFFSQEKIEATPETAE